MPRQGLDRAQGGSPASPDPHSPSLAGSRRVPALSVAAGSTRGRQPGRASRRRSAALELALPACVMLAVALWDIGGASFWRDEAATLSAVRRPLPELWSMLGHTDVVHAVYYLLMWAVVRVLGASELGARLPSAVAMSVAAGAVTAIGRRLISSRAGLAAGLSFAFFPVASRYGQEARSYAVVVAVATVASYLLVRALPPATDDLGGRSWAAGYGMAVTALGWLNLMSLLIIPAHAMTLILARRSQCAGPAALRRLWARWFIATGVALLLVCPLIIFAWPQRDGTSRFLALTSFTALGDMPARLTGSWPVLVVAVPLLIVAVWSGGQARAPLAWLCLPWLLLPPVVLLAMGTFTPVYDPRYILFCVPALALLFGSALDILAVKARPQKPGSVVLAGLTVTALIGLPSQLAYREPDGHVDNIRLAAHILAVNERPGDAVLYFPPWWRQLSAAYSYGFDKLHDISLARSPAQADDFTGVQLPVAQVRKKLAKISRVWLVEFSAYHPDPALDGGNWHTVTEWKASTILLILYEHKVS